MAEERTQSRLAFVDAARGLAVVLMLQTHAYDAWLRPELRGTEFFRWSQLIGGLPGALFLFLMGVSSALGNDKARALGVSSGALVRRGLGRAALLLAVAFAFRLTMYLASDRPDFGAVFRVDVLNCLSLALALVSLVDLTPGPNGRILSSLGIAAWFAIATPLAWDGGAVDGLPERLAGYLSGRVANTSFPLFPWAAFAFAGHATGSWIGKVNPGGLGRLMNSLPGLGIVLIPLSMALDRLPTLGSRYDYWATSPNFVLAKTGVLILILAACFHFERLSRRTAGIARSGLELVFVALIQMGRTSLFIYCVHVDLVYGSRALPKLWRSCEIGQASRNLAVLTLAMLALSYGWSFAKRAFAEMRAKGFSMPKGTSTQTRHSPPPH